jgi:hypothetical protein
VVVGQVLNVMMNLLALAIALVVTLGLVMSDGARRYPWNRPRTTGAGR